MKIFLFVCILVSVANYSFGQESCTPPDGGMGICKPISKCPPLLELAQKYRVASADEKQGIMDTLQGRACGFEGEEAKVCCNDCFTPDGKSGVIRKISKCPHLMTLFKGKTQEGMEFISKSRTFPNTRNAAACCGPPREIAPFPWENCDAQLTAFPPDPKSDCCGIDVHGDVRINGGNTTWIDEYPWTVLLEYKQHNKIRLYCGGTLISNRYVVTAAHCINGPNAWAPINVRVGEFDTENEGKDCLSVPGGKLDCTDGPAISIPIDSITIHENYSRQTNAPHDIALIRLKERVRYTEFVRPLCLPSLDVTVTTEEIELVAVGWGRLNDTHARSQYKQAVVLPLVKIPQCKGQYDATRTPPTLGQTQICAGGEAGKDSCNGDSGGPLVNTKGPQMSLAGVVSFGPHNCGTLGLPGVYTNVWEFKAWIWNNIRP